MQNISEKPKGILKHRSYQFALDIIKFLDTLDKKDYSVQVISKQLLRSATSIGANIIEAQAGSSKKDFANFYNYALKSANETKFWLGLLYDSGKAGSTDSLMKEAVELSNMLAASVLTLKEKRIF